MGLRVVRAIYKDGILIFAHPESKPRDGTEVILTYFEEVGAGEKPPVDPVQALRGRGRGERLVEKLLQSRREDREHDGSSHGSVRP
jgi:hypothetical protein